MEKTKFDLLFEDIMNTLSTEVTADPTQAPVLQSSFENEKYIEEYEYKPGWLIVISEITEDDDNKVYEFIIGKLDENKKPIDWPYFESSNEYVSPQEAKTWAEGQVEDFIEDELEADESDDEDEM